MKHPKSISFFLVLVTTFLMAFSIGPSRAGDIVEGPVTIDATGVHIEVSAYPDPANQLTFEDSGSNSFARIGSQDINMNDFYIIADPYAGADTFMHLSSLSSSGYTARTMLFSGETGAVQNVGISMLSGPGTNDRLDLNSFQTDADTYLWGTSTAGPVARVDAGNNTFNVTDLNITGSSDLNGETTVTGNFQTNTGFNGIGDAVTIPVSGGTLYITGANIEVDTEGAAGTDNLDCISGGRPGDRIYLHSKSGVRDTTIRFGVCNIISKGTSFTFTAKADLVVLFNMGPYWVVESAEDNN